MVNKFENLIPDAEFVERVVHNGDGYQGHQNGDQEHSDNEAQQSRILYPLKA